MEYSALLITIGGCCSAEIKCKLNKYKKMIQITEENLRNGINMSLGSLGIWTQNLSDYLFNEILALQQPPVSNCANCRKEYERGIEDGKIIAEHGTTMWID